LSQSFLLMPHFNRLITFVRFQANKHESSSWKLSFMPSLIVPKILTTKGCQILKDEQRTTNPVSSRQTPFYHKAVHPPGCCPPSSVCLRRSIGFLSKVITAVIGMNRQRCSQGPRSGGGEGQLSSSEAGARCLSQKRDLIQYEDEFSNRNNSTEPGS